MNLFDILIPPQKLWLVKYLRVFVYYELLYEAIIPRSPIFKIMFYTLMCILLNVKSIL